MDNTEDVNAEPQEIPQEEAEKYYKTEFAKYGCYPTQRALTTFFNKCLEVDGEIDSERVYQLCGYLKTIDEEKFWVNYRDVENFFEKINKKK